MSLLHQQPVESQIRVTLPFFVYAGRCGGAALARDSKLMNSRCDGLMTVLSG
jgi:hypothetical protein